MASQVNISGTTSGNFIKLDNMLLNALANDVLLAAQPVLLYENVVRLRTELLTTPGQTIQFLKYAPLSGKSDLVETSPIETSALSSSVVNISVKEHGKGVALTEFLGRTAIDDVLLTASIELGRHYARDLNREIRDTLLTLPATVYAANRADRATLTAADYLDYETTQDVSESLAIAKAPMYIGPAGGYYIGYGHPSVLRRLKVNAGLNWIPVKDYADNNYPGGAAMNGEVGRTDDIRWIQTTFSTYIKSGTVNIWADNLDTGDDTAIAINAATDVHQTVVVGDWACGRAIGLPVELREDFTEDFARTRKLAYYGIWGCGLIENGHGMIIESA